MAKYRVTYYKNIYVDDVTNENMAVMLADSEHPEIGRDFSVKVELVSE